MSNQFKTWATYGYQPIHLGAISRELLLIYFSVVRPLCLMGDDDYIFITFDGNSRHKYISRAIKIFMRDSINIDSSSNGLRTLVETEADRKMFAGEITPSQRESVSRINGHSSTTSRDYYVREQLGQHLVNSQAVLGLSTEDLGDIDQSQDIDYINWGTAHPDYGAVDGCRVKYSNDELRYLKRFATDFEDRNGKIGGTLSSQCLKQIRADPDAIPVFHQRHVFDSTRIRSGFRHLNILP